MNPTLKRGQCCKTEFTHPTGLSLGAIYLIVGLVVAVLKEYFDYIETFRGVLEALIAIIIWPAVLLGVDINVR